GVDMALSGRITIWNAALCMVRQSPVTGVGVRGFRTAYPDCDPHPDRLPAWGEGPAFHAHQIVLAGLSEPAIPGLLLWLAGAALAVTVFPLNTHLAFYSTFWGGLTLMLAALYAGSLLARE